MRGASLRDLMEGRSPYTAAQLHQRCDCGFTPNRTLPGDAWDWFPLNHTFAEHEVFINPVNRKESVC